MIVKSLVFSGFLSISIFSFSNNNVSLSIIRSWVDVEQVKTPQVLASCSLDAFLSLGRVYGLDTIHDLKLERSNESYGTSSTESDARG